MNQLRIVTRFVLVLALLSAGAAYADVKTEEKALVTFEGLLGRMVRLFGGKAAREGIVTTVAVKGDRKLTISEQTGQIIDLAEEKIYDLDMRQKRYEVTTFAELRRRMEQARKEAEESARRSDEKPADAPREVEIDFSLKESGERKVINGFDCREVIMTVTVREKGKTLELSGGIVLTANMWLGPQIAAMQGIADFERRYAEKLEGPFAPAVSAEQMAAMLALYPGVQEALGRFAAENVNLDGTPILTTVTLEAAKSAEQLAADKQRADEPPAGGGRLGGLAGRIARRTTKQDQQEPKARARIMAMTHEVLKVSTGVGESDVTIPAGFRER